MTDYAGPPGGLPPQTQLLTGRAILTDAYAVIPRGVMRDIVTSHLPGWDGMRMWVLARPLSGLAETFFQAAVELGPGGGSDAPETDAGVQSVLFVTSGALRVTCGDETGEAGPGTWVYLPAGAAWRLRSEGGAVFQWIRKRYVPAAGIAPPGFAIRHEDEAETSAMPGTEGRWATTRFVDPGDMAHDMQVNVVAFEPGAVIPFAETHVMEHGLYILEGKAVYRLNGDWVEVEAGDFLWLRAFCPQACYAGGPGRFRYLLYKDVNRLPAV